MPPRDRWRRVARRLPAPLVTGPLLLGYVVMVGGVSLAVIVGTGTALYYIDRLLGLAGGARVAYFALGVVVVMVEFTLLRSAFDRLGDQLFGEIPEEGWKP